MSKIDPKQAVDLAEVARLAEEKRVKDAAEQDARDREYVARWHRAMKKAFKGTGFTPWDRKIFLKAHLQRLARERDEAA